MKKRLAYLVFCLLTLGGFAQLPAGDRTLAWSIDVAEDDNFDSAFAYGYDACMQSFHLFFRWTDLEPDTAVFDTAFITNFLDVVDIYFPFWDMEVELQIAPTNTGVKEVPSELLNVSFDDPILINRFKIMLDTVFAHIPNLSLSALNIGNESDVNFGTNTAQYSEFKVFIDSVSAYAKNLYAGIHGADLKVGTTFTHHGLVNTATAALCNSVNQNLDIVAVTYYPLNPDFTMKPPGVVSSDFGALVSEYSDPAQPIYFVECGYASSTLCNSSEALQADFWVEVFDAWDAYYENIKYVTVFKSTDWSAATVNELAEYYNIQDTIFKEYLRTLGVRTWEGEGSNKEAYERILCELADRDWCGISCALSSSEYATDEDFSIFPNPAYDVAFIDLDQSFKPPYTCRLYNAQGQLVREMLEPSNPIVLERLALRSGVYFVHLEHDGHTFKLGKLIFQ